jgi:hypothetical protein
MVLELEWLLRAVEELLKQEELKVERDYQLLK